MTNELYTVRFSFKGSTGHWTEMLDPFASERFNNGSRTFSTKEEADRFINEDGPKEYRCFTYHCTEHIGDLSGLGRAINSCRRNIPRSECSDESIVGGYSR